MVGLPAHALGLRPGAAVAGAAAASISAAPLCCCSRGRMLAAHDEAAV